MERIFKNNNGKMAGYLMNDGVYRKKVVRSKHLMKMFNGYGIDSNIIDDLTNLECKEIRVLEVDTGILWHCTFKVFLDNMIKKNFDGLQCFLPNKYWEKDNPKQKQLI